MTDKEKSWRTLRDLFDAAGFVSLPSNEDLLRDLDWDRPQFRWFSGLIGDENGIRDMTEDEIAKMNAAEEALAKWRKHLFSGFPMIIGVDLSAFGSETWEMRYDWKTGKIIYRKLDPADMVPPDEGEEGIHDNER